jgi:hypothetical protein
MAAREEARRETARKAARAQWQRGEGQRGQWLGLRGKQQRRTRMEEVGRKNRSGCTVKKEQICF